MREKRLGVILAVVVALLVIAVGIPAFGTQQPDDYQDNYIEECESYRNHSGYIPGYYDYAVFFEQGQEPIHVETWGEPIYLPPPDGESWDRVYKCKRDEETTTTTTVEETTTTVGEETTTTVEGTTTTVGQETTTTVGDSTTTIGDTTTTDPGDSTLPFTGIKDADNLIPIGVLALGAGGTILTTTIRRRRED